jgi:hypothetical protein
MVTPHTNAPLTERIVECEKAAFNAALPPHTLHRYPRMRFDLPVQFNLIGLTFDSRLYTSEINVFTYC